MTVGWVRYNSGLPVAFSSADAPNRAVSAETARRAKLIEDALPVGLLAKQTKLMNGTIQLELNGAGRIEVSPARGASPAAVTLVASARNLGPTVFELQPALGVEIRQRP